MSVPLGSPAGEPAGSPDIPAVPVIPADRAGPAIPVDRADHPDPADPAVRAETPVTTVAGALSDGEWHRLHPASPILKGGIALLAAIGIVLTNLREQLIEMLVPRAGFPDDDPIRYLLDSGLIVPVLLGSLGVLVVLVGIFSVSWRMHTFRITDEVVEVRSGVVFRTNRKARLDRIQGINIVRPVLARLVGAARLEVNQAGQDANVRLEYLGSAAADDLRLEILRLASGTRAPAQSRERAPVPGSLAARRLDEFLAPELDPNAAGPESIVRMTVGRLIGSTLLSGVTVVVLIVAALTVLGLVFQEEVAQVALFAFLPIAIGAIGFSLQRVTKSLRYSISGTPDGIRVGFGLLSTTNETLPPGRIHSIRISQPLLWRLPGWWEIKINRAGNSSTRGAAGQQNTTILPVGSLGDVRRVLGLVLPDFLRDDAVALVERGLSTRGSVDDGFVTSPRRAAVLRWFSWRRNGFAIRPGAILLRKGAIWRELIVVPLPRIQSVSVRQGPVLRMLRLAAVHLHTVSGPIVAELGALDRSDALAFFESIADAAVHAARSDTSDRGNRVQEIS